ncbi:fimbria/pilus chaperone family protein [Serratia proteamaculans]|uniref:fimbria/pilus chaperone family protein n=1 Tax=Serratia proteamaculans TaxID=28151 RepID=UPI00217BE4DE|nr:fimbria/pilus chaperone family protein [Serratia proteamaculans]CAI1794758.1 Capsule protein fraction 1 [Serratia proteamaculans]CAI2418033.1 Capsule protein fraction 1 [Serratia proteamaculans]
MLFFSSLRYGALVLSLFSTTALASGVVPDSSVVIVEGADGEGSINVKNTDPYPVLLLTQLENIPEDSESLLTVTPPAARVEPGKSQSVRFLLTTKTPLKTERLKRVTFEGVPPQQKGKSEVRMTVRQNLPLIIRPAGLARDEAPWKHLVWQLTAGKLTVSNPSPYVVRLGQGVQTLPGNSVWMLANSYVLPGQALTLTQNGNKAPGSDTQVRISPATTWGFSVDHYDAPLVH